MVRRHVLILGVLGLVLSVAGSALAEIRYSVTDLGTLPGYNNVAVDAAGINASGQIVGTVVTSNVMVNGVLGQGFLYSNGQMTAIGPLPGDSFSVATAISDGGQIVGYSYPPYSPPPPPPFQTGNVAAGGLKSAGGTVFGSDATSSYPSYASGINSTGQVVGTSGTSSGAVFPLAGNTCHAFLFNSGAISDLGNLGGSVTAATGINANGSVVGFGTGADGVEHAFLYNGTMNNLGSLGLASTHGFLYNEGGLTDLGVLSGFASSTAAAINASGQAVGTCTDSTGWVMHGFLCKNGAMTDLGTLPGCAGSQALGINANGQVVGCTLTIQTTPPISYLAPASAFLYSAGAMVDLNSLIDPASGWTLTSATAINDSGWIVGNGTNSLGQSHAFLLTPIPEPSTAALAASGLAAVLLAAWRRRKRGR